MTAAVHPGTGQGGLPALRLAHPSGATAEVCLHGAHATSWIPAGSAEALFVSRAARFAPDTAIRGGVPVIFPQFADTGPLPKHGFARTQPWERVEDEAPADDGHPAVRLRLRDSGATRRTWPHPFAAEMRIQLGEDWLGLTLFVHNPGAGAISFTCALHTYLRVADVRQAAVQGLRGLRYRGREHGERLRVDEDAELAVAGEVDRVYLDTPPELRVHDRAGGRVIRVTGDGFADTVVWNPWKDGAASLPDMQDDEYLEMLCVEAAQVGTPVHLPPGGTWSGTQRLQAIRG